MDILRTKSVEKSMEDTEDAEFKLKKNLSALDLMVFGIGVIIGAGIFTLTGRAAADYAGPAVVFSFAIAAICCGLAALCYAEFASTVPVSGSAYTFSYATLGELVAWIIGWDLILELMLGASVVAQGWSTYFVTFLEEIGLGWPDSLGPSEDAGFGHFNLAAFVLVAALVALIAVGIKESLRVNLVLVGIKLFIVLFVIVAGLFYIKGGNYHPFVPPAADPQEATGLTQPLFQWLFGIKAQTYGVLGIVSGASVVFFAYIGFDVVATTAEEARNPQKDLPRGIIGSLVICTVLYIAVALVITGMVKYDEIDGEAALASAFQANGKDGFATLIAAGAVAGLTTVVMTLMIGAVRVLFAMSRDGLLPREIRQGQPAHRHAAADHADHRRPGRRGGVADPDRQARGDGQHRHAHGVRPGLARGADPAQAPSRPGARVQGAVQPGAADRRVPRLRLPRAQPEPGDVAAVPGLDGAGLPHLLHLRLPPQPRRAGRG